MTVHRSYHERHADELLDILREMVRVYETGDWHSEFKPALDRAKAFIEQTERTKIALVEVSAIDE